MSGGEIDLLPCPFCGGRASIQRGGKTKYVMCMGCDVMGPNLESSEELIAAWNKRIRATMIPPYNGLIDTKTVGQELFEMMISINRAPVVDPIKRISGKEKS